MCVIDSSIPISNMPFKFILILTIFMSNNIMDNLDLIIQGLLLNFLNQNFKFLSKHIYFFNPKHTIWVESIIKYERKDLVKHGTMRLDLAWSLIHRHIPFLKSNVWINVWNPENYFNNRWIALAMITSHVKMILYFEIHQLAK
jgi:hypothetical protein